MPKDTITMLVNQRLQEKKIELFFQKQDLWIKDKQDLGSRILLAILAIITSYEIELFAERSISGKINKVYSRQPYPAYLISQMG